MAKRQKHNYVDNKKFLAEMIKFRQSVIDADKGRLGRSYIRRLHQKIATLSYGPTL